MTVRAGVAGAGAFGAIHAGKYAAEPRTTLVGVYDVDYDRARVLAESHGGAGFDNFDRFLGLIDVLTIATPARTHGQLARKALLAGKHVLVEKPISVTPEEAAGVIAAARSSGVTLACGHQERLVFAVMGLLAVAERPILIEARREGPWSGRGADVSVTLDLAIHDADLAMRLVGGRRVRVTARGERIKGDQIDVIEGEAEFAHGAIVRLAASRVAEARRRTMRIVYPSGEVTIDFVHRTFANTTRFPLDSAFADTPIGKDPLGANVSRFLDAVQGRSTRPVVTGEEAAAALDLVVAMDAAAG